MRLGRGSLWVLMWLAGATFLPTTKAQERPLPDLQTFLAQARQHLRTDPQLLSQYTFRQRETELHLTKFGKLTTGPIKVYEVYPALNPDDSYRRLVEVDGKPRDAAELARDDRKHQQRVLADASRREHETASDREKRLRQEAKERQEYDDLFDDVFRVYAFSIVARQSMDGHSTVIVDFKPRPEAVAKTPDGKSLKKIKGRAWVSEDDYELVRVEALMLEDLAVRGFLGKLYAGTTASFSRRKINGEVWLPSEVSVKATGRALIRKFNIDMLVQYSDYRKFTVRTDTEFSLPPAEGTTK
ncbi:MAG: hypothetical protein DMF89_25420 [Acidobacteria bacterium]|nr:MAG: hypothetical protein DMF89_25420 [Acidobacteriota bacterium]